MKPKLTFSYIVCSVLITTLVIAVQAPSVAMAQACDTVECISQRNTPKHPRKFKRKSEMADVTEVTEVRRTAPVASPAAAQSRPADDRAIRSAIQIIHSSSQTESEPEVAEITPRTESGMSCMGADGCGSSKGMTGNQIIARLQNTAEVIKEISETTEKQAPKCSAFADEDGLNEWGKLAVKNFHDPLFKKFYDGTPDIHRYCPNYKNMKDVEKDGLQLILLSGVSNAEASCNPKARLAQKKGKKFGAPNGTAAGLIQLHLGKEDRYSKITEACVKNASLDVEDTIRCYLGMGTERAMKDKDWITLHHFAVLDLNAKPRRGKRLNEAQILVNSIKSYEFCKVSNNAGIKTAKN